MRAPTTDQLRDDIDSGRTGEKVAMSDPAAAPMGTDAEAGGAPPTSSERALAAKSAPAKPVSDRPPPNGVIVYLALVLGVAVAVIVTALAALG